MEHVCLESTDEGERSRPPRAWLHLRQEQSPGSPPTRPSVSSHQTWTRSCAPRDKHEHSIGTLSPRQTITLIPGTAGRSIATAEVHGGHVWTPLRYGHAVSRRSGAG